MALTYAVTTNFTRAPLPSIEKAIQRYCAVLEQKLGGPERVASCYRTWQNLEGRSPTTEEERQSAEAWRSAHDEARQAASSILGQPPGDYFVVRALTAFF